MALVDVGQIGIGGRDSRPAESAAESERGAHAGPKEPGPRARQQPARRRSWIVQVSSSEHLTGRAWAVSQAHPSLLTLPLQWPIPMDSISIRGARQHNLKNLHLEIPRGQLV